jgi:hypothetical protein
LTRRGVADMARRSGNVVDRVGVGVYVGAYRRIAILASLALLAGCASERTSPRYLYPPADASCPAVDPRQPAASRAAPLGGEFAPVAAAICPFDVVVDVRLGGGWRWRTVQRTDGPFDGLITALRTPPPTTRKAHLACPDTAQAPMLIALTDATGRAVIPAIPADPCGFRISAVDQAVAALDWVTVEKR